MTRTVITEAWLHDTTNDLIRFVRQTYEVPSAWQQLPSEEIARREAFDWWENNYACDCNRNPAMYGHDGPRSNWDNEHPCGDSIRLIQLSVAVSPNLKPIVSHGDYFYGPSPELSE